MEEQASTGIGLVGELLRSASIDAAIASLKVCTGLVGIFCALLVFATKLFFKLFVVAEVFTFFWVKPFLKIAVGTLRLNPVEVASATPRAIFQGLVIYALYTGVNSSIDERREEDLAVSRPSAKLIVGLGSAFVFWTLLGGPLTS